MAYRYKKDTPSTRNHKQAKKAFYDAQKPWEKLKAELGKHVEAKKKLENKSQTRKNSVKAPSAKAAKKMMAEIDKGAQWEQTHHVQAIAALAWPLSVNNARACSSRVFDALAWPDSAFVFVGLSVCGASVNSKVDLAIETLYKSKKVYEQQMTLAFGSLQEEEKKRLTLFKDQLTKSHDVMDIPNLCVKIDAQSVLQNRGCPPKADSGDQFGLCCYVILKHAPQHMSAQSACALTLDVMFAPGTVFGASLWGTSWRKSPPAVTSMPSPICLALGRTSACR